MVGLGVRHRGQDHFGAAELGQFFGGVLLGAVYIDLRPELLRQGPLSAPLCLSELKVVMPAQSNGAVSSDFRSSGTAASASHR